VLSDKFFSDEKKEIIKDKMGNIFLQRLQIDKSPCDFLSKNTDEKDYIKELEKEILKKRQIENDIKLQSGKIYQECFSLTNDVR